MENKKEFTIKDSVVEFYDDTHTYLIDGIKTLSATQIGQLINPFKIMNIPSHILQKAGERGTKIHEAIEQYLTDGTFMLSEDDPHYGYFEAFLKFYDEHGKDLEIESLEHIAISKEYSVPLVGTIDFQGKYKGEPIIIDWKTSSMPTLPEWRTQLSIYRELVRYTHGIEEVNAYVLWLKKDGTYEFLSIAPMKPAYFKLMMELLEYTSVIERFNLLKYEVYGDELSK